MPQRSHPGLFRFDRDFRDLLGVHVGADNEFNIHSYIFLCGQTKTRYHERIGVRHQFFHTGKTLDLRTVRSVKLDCTRDTPGNRVSFCR